MTAQEAFDYIANLLPDFQKKGETLYQQLNAANLLRAKIRSTGSDTSEIDALYNEIYADLQQWNQVKDKIVPVANVFGVTGLGLDPFTLLTIGGTLIAIASALAFFYANNRINQHATAIRTIAGYVEMTPEDQAIVNEATTQSWFTFPGIEKFGQYLLIGGAIYLAIILFRK